MHRKKGSHTAILSYLKNIFLKFNISNDKIWPIGYFDSNKIWFFLSNVHVLTFKTNWLKAKCLFVQIIMSNRSSNLLAS